MTLTAADIIKHALNLIHAIGVGETPTDDEYAQALVALNAMLGSWATQRLVFRATTSINFPLVVGQASYTIGPDVSCDVNKAKPTRVRSAYYRDAANIDTNLVVITKEDYTSLSDKAITDGMIYYVMYDPGATQQSGVNKGTIYFYSIPATADTAYLEVDGYLTEFSATTDTVTFDPMYYEALVYNLATRLFRYYRDANIMVPADIASIAQSTLSNIKNANAVRFKAFMEVPSGDLTYYNIYSDGNS